MKGNEKVAVYLGTFVFVIIGCLVSLIVSDILYDVLYELELEILTQEIIPGQTRSYWLVFALGWFIVCFLTYFGSTRWLESGEKLGILSLFFFILWFITTLAIVIANIVKILLEGGAATIDLDFFLDQLFIALFWALAPTIAALLGVSNKASSHQRD
ncbi:MAG: hypothetical protein JSV04_13855 [Candidatus Heimdallarchaeota archaeon]|nr:MAG: hypothetical protein JSV04_13855 [Candidatus Heimdallarchaeota archaeon]